MKIGYTPREWNTSPTVAIAGGAWLTVDGGAACVDGEPSRVARYQAAGVATVTLTLPSAVPVGVAAVLGLKGVVAGAGVTVTAGGQVVPGEVQEFADGTLGVFVLVMGAAASNTVQFALPAGTVDVGELVALPITDIEHEADWSVEVVDPSEIGRTRGSSLSTLQRVPYRRLDARLAAVGKAAVRHGGLPGGMDLERLAAVTAGGRRCLFVPRYRTPAGGVDKAELNASAIYGKGRVGTAQHVSGDWYRSSCSIEEVPAY